MLSSNSSSNKSHSVVIIGAGCAGIAAARLLIDHGIKPILLEARDRIGGRMHRSFLMKNLIDDESGDKVTIQLGANWIHGLHESNPLYTLAKSLSLDIYPTSSDDEPGDDVALFCSGERISLSDYHTALEIFNWVREKAEEVLEVNEELNTQEAFDRAILDYEAVNGAVVHGKHRSCINWFLSRISIDLAAELKLVGSKSMLEGESDGLRGEGVVLGQGYFTVLEHLAEDLSLDIKLNHVVRTIIATEDNKVIIECMNGSSFSAEACLLTAPVSMVQRPMVDSNTVFKRVPEVDGKIQLLPHIPSRLHQLCNTVELGLMNLVWLWFPHFFWPDGCNFLAVALEKGDVAETFGTFLVPPVFNQTGERQPVLMCQVCGEFARKVEQMSNQQIAQEATAALRQAVGGTMEVPDPIGCTHSSWGSDPFAMGSWSFHRHRKETQKKETVKLKTTEDDNESFCSGHQEGGCEKCRRMLYAGEAMSVEHRGTAHGAFISGTEEAGRIVRLFKEEATLSLS